MKLRVLVKIGRRQGLTGWDGSRLYITIDAPPIDGGANTKLIEAISEWLDVSKSRVQISKGHTARYKTLEIDITEEQLNQFLSRLPKLPTQEKLL